MENRIAGVWVKASERLPEIGEYVFIIVGTDTILKGRLMGNGWTAFFADGEKLVRDVRPVTYWMPLPNLPLDEYQPIPEYVDGLKKLLRIANCPEILIEYPNISNSSRTPKGLKWAEEAMRRYESAQPEPIPVNQDEYWKDLFYRLEAIVIRLRNMNTNIIATNTYQNVLDEIKQLKSNSFPVQQKMDEDEFADWMEVSNGIGAALAVFNECKITVPEDHPDPTAINDCISMTRDAQILFNKLKKKYLESPVHPEKKEK